MRYVILAVVVAVAGCAGSPARLGMMDEATLVQQPPQALCNAYAFSKNEKYLTALKERQVRLGGELSSEDEAVIRAGVVFVGMKAHLLPCVKQMTPGYYKVNSTYTANGVRQQHVWMEGMYHTISMIVYTEGGYVTAIQYL